MLNARIITGLVIFQLLLGQIGTAQSVDSLLLTYQKASIDSNKIKILLQIANTLQGGKPDSAIYYYDLGLTQCNRPVLLPFKAELIHQKGVALDILGKEEGMKLFDEAEKIFANLEDTVGIGRVELNRGVSYHHQSLYDKAMIHYFKAHDYFEQVDEIHYRSRVLNNVAILYRKQAKYERAIEIYEQSLDLKKQLKDSLGIATSLMNIASTYDYMGEKDKMLEFFKSALDQYTTINNEEGIAYCHLSMGQALLNQGDKEEAEGHLLQAQEFYKTAPHSRSFGFVLEGLANIAMQNKDYEKVIELLEPQLDNIRQRKRLEITQAFLLYLGKAKGELGAHKQAFEYLEEASVLKDTIVEKNRVALTEEMQSRFDLAQKDKELLIAKLQLDKKNQQQRVYLAGALLAGLLLLGGTYLIYQKNKTNKLLSEKNKIINQSLTEKEALVKEIQHRVERNMEFISSLLHLQTEHLADDSAIAALKESENRVASMSLLHRNLYQEEEHTNINIQSYLNQLIDNISDSYEINKAGIEVKKELAHMLIDVDRAIPIGLIINELLSNVFKHGVQHKDIDLVRVTLKEQNNKIFLEVKENQINASEKVRKISIRSFGLKLINLLVDQLQATWNVSEKEGTHISISLPK